MRLMKQIVVAAAVGMLLAPQLATATEIDEKLRLMDERMVQMEDRLQAATDQLTAANARVEAQRDVIESAGIAEERGSGNALSSFIEKTDISGWAAVSYNYNFNGSKSGDGGNTGGMGNGQNGFIGHSNPNSFQLDQFWIEIDKTPTQESRAGFHADFSAGKATDSTAGDALTVNLFSAYVSYLAPLGKDVQIDAGQIPTMFGGELIQTNANFNITRGIVWGIQPTTGLGAVASTELIDGLTVALGALNSPTSNDRGLGADAHVGKALTSRVTYATDRYMAAAGVNYGPESKNNKSTMLLDVLLTASPTDNLATWINYDYKELDNSAGTPDVNQHAVAVAARIAVLESTGLAARAEYLRTETAGAGSTKAFSLTGTADHALTDNLTLKAEVRWDNTKPGLLLSEDNVARKENQVVVLGQLLYEF